MYCSVAQLYKPPAPIKSSLGKERQVLCGVDKARGTAAPFLCSIHSRNDQAITEQCSCPPLDRAGALGRRPCMQEEQPKKPRPVMTRMCLLAAQLHCRCRERPWKSLPGFGLEDLQLGCFNWAHQTAQGLPAFSDIIDTLWEVHKLSAVCLLLNTMGSVIWLETSSGNVFLFSAVRIGRNGKHRYD